MHRIALGFLLALVMAPAAQATHTQPPLDMTKLPYEPIGVFKDGDPLPAPNSCDTNFKPQMKGRVYNPSGKWNSFDTEIFEVVCLPFRAPGDESDQDPYGNGGDPRHGFCGQPSDPTTRPGNPAYNPGVCPNHQLEYGQYFGDTMKEILGDFGVTIRQYFFEVDESVESPPGNTLGGRALNTAAVVPGADHPEETIVIGAHYDQTNDGPASAWDSQEGHAEIIRIAKKMADYWRATGTRPSATVKFIPWDGEESGTLGSRDYASNNIVPGEENKVRGYWNTDPCAGGYPSYIAGNPTQRYTMGVQLGDKAQAAEGDPARIDKFNERAPKLIEEVLDFVDDTVPTVAGDVETFISAKEGTSDLGQPYFTIGYDAPVLFSSDWRNFIQLGIPFFNPGPEVTGPNQGEGGVSPGGPPLALVGFHTPVDNLETMMRLTGPPPAGVTITDSYAKGMEFCSQMLSWGMLQHDQGGAQTANADPVAYAEVLPNEAPKNAPVKFDGSGSYQYSDVAKRTLVSDDDLEYRWTFGDGSGTFYGKVLQHSYKRIGKFKSVLTVENIRTGKSASITIPVTVEDSDKAPGAGDSPQGSAKPRPANPGRPGATGCTASSGFISLKVTPAGKGLTFDFQRAGDTIVSADLLQVSKGRKALAKAKSVRKFTGTEKFTWNGTLKKGKLANGLYELRVTTQGLKGKDTRRFAFTRTAKGFKAGKPFEAQATCDLVSVFALGSSVLNKRLAIQYRLGSAGKAEVTIKRGSKLVKKFKAKSSTANQLVKLKYIAKKVKRGQLTVTLKATGGGKTVTRKLYTLKP
jgi:hypothetical protein